MREIGALVLSCLSAPQCVMFYVAQPRQLLPEQCTPTLDCSHRRSNDFAGIYSNHSDNAGRRIFPTLAKVHESETALQVQGIRCPNRAG